MTVRAEQVTDVVAVHGEGPVWDPRSGSLRWLDMLAGDVLTLRGSGQVERWHVGKVAALWRPRSSGGSVVAVERGFRLVDPDGSVHALPDVFTDPAVRMNEGGCDPQGRLYCGTLAYDETPGAGTLYRLDVDGTVSRVLEGVTISNGLGWSPDGSTAYYVDSPTHRIDAFDFDADSGLLGDRRPLVEIDVWRGSPDGLTVDAEGGLWVAMCPGGTVLHYSPEGELQDVVPLPVVQVTACTFGGPGLDHLYITTSRNNLGASAERQAGAVFVAEPGVRGLPVLAFAG